MIHKDDAELGFFTSAANSLVERLRITRTGDIGVGTSDPKTQLVFNIQQLLTLQADLALYLENNFGITICLVIHLMIASLDLEQVITVF